MEKLLLDVFSGTTLCLDISDRSQFMDSKYSDKRKERETRVCQFLFNGDLNHDKHIYCHTNRCVLLTNVLS
jgi:hypothetical protein